MVFEKYAERLYNKVAEFPQRYARYMFNRVGTLENPVYLETKEHLRNVPEAGWREMSGAHEWKGEWNNLWIKGTYTVPENLKGKKLYAISDSGAVEVLFFINGKPSGIFNSRGDEIGGLHSNRLITLSAVPGECFELAFECYAGHFFAGDQPFDRYGQIGEQYDPQEDFRRRYTGTDICVIDESVKGFIYDLKTVLQLAKLPESDMMRARAMNALTEVFKVVSQYPADMDESDIRESVAAAREYMKEVLGIGGNDGTRGKVGVIGHSHMDTAWLWPVSETIRKCARTFSNALALMEEYPEYKFIQSSVLHIEWMRKYYPDIFKEMKKRISEGRYEPNGAVWVECDCNLPSGEMMARQFIHGQLYTRKHFNYTADCFWLPDTFGYNAAIPQIMLQSEVKYFCTTKISWNDLNTFPYDTFIWEGQDGSRVLTHYNLTHCFPDVETTVRAVKEIKDKQVCEKKLLAFGYGDGGGGPTWGMLEDSRRVRKLAGIPGQYYTTVSEFMSSIEKESVGLPVYSGELYLELHRGTLTQMHDIKRNNRKAEYAIRNMEYFNVISGGSKNVRSAEILKALLQNQFHDILPGTCITPVNENTKKETAKIILDAESETEKYLNELTDGSENCITVFNTLPFARNDNVKIENLKGVPEGYTCQQYADICGRNIAIIGGVEIPAFGYTEIKLSDQKNEAVSPFIYTGNTLETPFLNVEFDDNGFIVSLVLRGCNREVRNKKGNPLNTFYIGEDVPRIYDNWDIDSDQYLKMQPCGELIERNVVSDGAAEFVIRSKYRISDKTELIQDMIFSAYSARIDFHTVVDWNDVHRLLKVGFDCDINSSFIKNEIQFGNIDRPTTRNNCYEAAKYEVCNHKWSDMSESRFGVALLNDCKYGISAEGSDMRLSLLRGGIRPDVTGDRGKHEFTYSLLSHDGAFGAETVIYPAYMLNMPYVIAKGKIVEPIQAPALVSQTNIICETVKPAELIENAYVLRLYESERCKTNCTITLPSYAKRCFRTNFLEDIKEEIAISDGNIHITFKPFEIVTLLILKK